MFYQYKHYDDSENINVCGIPFNVKKDNRGVVVRLPEGQINIKCQCDVLFFLGMATDSTFCSEWWGQQEVMYDHTTRVFLGDRLMRIRIIFDDETEELVSVIFGVNAWNYNLYYRPHDREQLSCWDAPYNEPFTSDENAKALKDACLKLMENTDPEAEKCTKWVFGYKLRPGKTVKEIHFYREGAKHCNVAISAITGLNPGAPIDPDWTIVDQSFFLKRAYYEDLYRLSHRLYQYRSDLPATDPKIDIDNFDAPDITFTGNALSEIYTNVYRKNIIDMAYGKVDDDGRSHTSTPLTANFGCYVGFGTFKDNCDSYGGHVWTRDIGRTLSELTNLGYFDRVKTAADYLHQLLYYPSVRFPIPHWKRVANLDVSNDRWLDGNENDGHAAVMMFIYTMYRKGAVGKDWIIEHKKELKDAADYFLWQMNNPDKSNYNGMLYSHSETSTQITGGYDLFANIISSYALYGYSVLFELIGEKEYSELLLNTSNSIRNAAIESFTMKHPVYGNVVTDTTDDCWTYEYKRMVDLLLFSDFVGYDMALDNPELFDMMNRTFLAEKEVFYAPESGRQMGYGQGYLTQEAIMLDRYEELTECIEAAAMFCYHHTDHNYIVPEGVIVHGSKQFWYRNSDLGNAVQQAEIVKCARLLVGIDDISSERGIRLIPRLPNNWDSIDAKSYPITLPDKTVTYIDFTYTRKAEEGRITATCGDTAYTANWTKDINVEYIRMGPFNTPDISISTGTVLEIKNINDKYFAYVKL